MLLAQIMEGLPDRERTILQLRFVDELSQAEIAQRVGISQMHVSRLLRRTLATLKEHLGRQLSPRPRAGARRRATVHRHGPSDLGERR